MYEFLHFHAVLQHLVGHFFIYQPSGSVVSIIFGLPCSNLRWHHLQAICDCDVLTLQVFSVAVFVQTTEAFGLERTLACQVLDCDGCSVNFESEIIDWKTMKKALDPKNLKNTYCQRDLSAIAQLECW